MDSGSTNPKKTTDPNRKAVICSQRLKDNINQYVGKDKDFLSFSDFTLTACRFVLEQHHLQTLEFAYRDALKSLTGKDVEWSMLQEPIEPINFIRQEGESSGSKTLVTFPKGLVDDLTRMAMMNFIKFTDLVRYCLEYYLREYENRKKSDKRLDALLKETVGNIYRQRVVSSQPK